MTLRRYLTLCAVLGVLYLGFTLIAHSTAQPARPSRECQALTATIIGTEHRDVLVGTDHQDIITGKGGNDVIVGYDGNDFICGGPGNDVIYPGGGLDGTFGGHGHDVCIGVKHEAAKHNVFGCEGP